MKKIVVIFIGLCLCVSLSSCLNRHKFNLTIANSDGKSLYVVDDDKLSGELVFNDKSYLTGSFKVYYDKELLIEEKLMDGLKVEENGKTNFVWELSVGRYAYGNYMIVGDENKGDRIFFVGVLDSDVSFTFVKRSS